jgi:hypothetical protein
MFLLLFIVLVLLLQLDANGKKSKEYYTEV